MQRLATRKAKPDNIFYLAPQPNVVQEFLRGQNIADLPGIGWSNKRKFDERNLTTVEDALALSKSDLQNLLGNKTGETMYQFCRGIDIRVIENTLRKSIGAEVNWGIRFETDAQFETFLRSLAVEVGRRLRKFGSFARKVVFKLQIRSVDAPVEPHKFLGCGKTDSITRSVNLNEPIDDPDKIYEVCINVWKTLKGRERDVQELRGVGIQLNGLESEEVVNGGSKQRRLDHMMRDMGSKKKIAQSEHAGLDLSIVNELPPEIRDEIMREYSLGSGSTMHGGPPEPKVSPSKRKITDFMNTSPSPKKSRKEQTISSPLKTPVLGKELTRGESMITPSDMQPTLSQVDNSVLDALPSLIRDELMEQWRNPGAASKKRDIVGNLKTPRSRGLLRREDSFAYTLPSPSQLDPKVLAALPIEIRNEVEKESLRIRQLGQGQQNQSVAKTSTSEFVKNKDGFLAPPMTIMRPKKNSFNNITPSQIDKSIFDGLPADIQRQVQKDMEFTKIRQDRTNDRRMFDPSKNENDLLHSRPIYYQPTRFQGHHEWEEIRDCIFNLVNRNPAPLETDLSELRAFLMESIEKLDLELCCCAMKWLRRCIAMGQTSKPSHLSLKGKEKMSSRLQSEVWADFYEEMRRLATGLSLDTYGSKLVFDPL